MSSGRYDYAFLGAGALCLVAAALSLAFRRGETKPALRGAPSLATGD